jgi:glycogen debranching enzyme
MRSFFTLAEMAEALGRHDEASAHRQLASEIRNAFEVDWWMPEEGMYADSRHSTGRNQFDGHWTVMLPVQLGLAAPDRAAQVLDRVLREWVSQWGLVHTREREERVWTLPTGLLALALFNLGRADEGLKLLHCIASTANVGLLGAFEELIPQGMCFIQLWSAGLILEGVVAGLLGIQPDGLSHSLTIAPKWPAGWDEMQLNGLKIGEHLIDLTVRPASLQVRHRAGEHALSVLWRSGDGERRASIVPGATQELAASTES